MGLNIRPKSGRIANGSRLIVDGQPTTGIKVFTPSFKYKMSKPTDNDIYEAILPFLTSTPNPTASPNPTPQITPTPTNTPNSTPTSTPANTPNPTPTNTPTLSNTPTNTPTLSNTPTLTSTPTPTPTTTLTNTPTPTTTPTVTLTPSTTPTNTPTVTQTPSVTLTNTPTLTVTPSPQYGNLEVSGSLDVAYGISTYRVYYAISPTYNATQPYPLGLTWQLLDVRTLQNCNTFVSFGSIQVPVGQNVYIQLRDNTGGFVYETDMNPPFFGNPCVSPFLTLYTQSYSIGSPGPVGDTFKLKLIFPPSPVVAP
jgi:hypothetical protein